MSNRRIEFKRMLMKDFIFHRFSEIEIVVLSWVLVILIFVYWEFLINFFVFSQEDFGATVLFFLFLIGVIYALVYFPVNRNKMSSRVKKTYALYFYLILSAFSAWSVVELLSGDFIVNDFNILDIFNLLFILWILLRSLMTFFFTLAIGRLRKTEVLVSQVDDDQLVLHEFVLIIIGGLGLYFYLSVEYEVASTVVLIYFYLTTALSLKKWVIDFFGQSG